MTQIEELFKLSYKPGITEEKFMHELAAEAFKVSCANFETRKDLQRTYQEIKDGTRKHMPGLKWILDCFYELKRHPVAIKGVRNPEQKQKEMLEAMRDDSLMVLSDQKGTKPILGKDVEDEERSFLHRWPKNRHQKGWSTGDRTFGRFTINADMNPNMIKELDRFCSNHRCTYKTSYPSCWEERVDPVNMYIHEPITDELKKEFVGIMQKYIRHSRSNLNHLLDGDTLVPGITCATEWTYDEGIHFIRSLPTQFQKDAFEFAHGQNEGEKIAMSLGQRTSLEEFFKLYKQYKPKLKTTTKTLISKVSTPQTPVKSMSQQAPTPTTTGIKKVVLAPPTDRTFKRVVKGIRTLTTALSKASNTVDIFKQYDSDNKLRQTVISNGQYQTVFNYDKNEEFSSMVIQDKNGNTYAKFSKTPKGYVVQKASNVSCSGFGPKPLNTPFSIEDVRNQIRFETKDKTTGKDISLATMGIMSGSIAGFRIMDEKGSYDAVEVRGTATNPVNSTTIRQTDLSFIETTPNHPKEIQILPCKDKAGHPAVRVLDEKGKEIYARVQRGENDFEQIYPNGLHSRVWKEKDGTNMNLIWDPRDPTAGYIKRKEGKIVSENKGTGSLRQRLTELQNTGRIRGQILKRLPGKTSGVVK